jgi:hypothetical protein
VKVTVDLVSRRAGADSTATLRLPEQIFLDCITGTPDSFGTIVGRLNAFLFQES